MYVFDVLSMSSLNDEETKILIGMLGIQSLKHRAKLLQLFNRPGVAGAVLQSPPSLIDSFVNRVIILFRIFKTLSIPNRKRWRADILRECSPPTMCQISRVTCQVSGVMCQVSCVRCQVSHFFIFLFC